MGYLIVYIKPAAEVDSKEHSDQPPLIQLSTRAALSDHSITGSGWPRLCALLAKHGYEVRPEFGSYNPREWPFTAVAYTSMNKDGIGRSGSSLYRLPCRKQEQVNHPGER